MTNSAFDTIHADLTQRLRRAAAAMVVASEEPGRLVLHAPWTNPMKPKEPVWFGAVEIKKSYVSFHLIPLYSHPSLGDGMSPALKKRMQGKSCFNFKKVEPDLFDELEKLATTCAEVYASPITVARHGKGE